MQYDFPSFQSNQECEVSPLERISPFGSSECPDVELMESMHRLDLDVGMSPMSPAPIKPPTLDTGDPPSTVSPKRHIPRPPNAFMIYRSELLKTGAIPLNIERRQQNLSRLAGQCWNLLTSEEKDVYHKKSDAALREHQRLNPDYKFTPAPRGSRRTKAKAQSNDNANTTSSERIRAIREQYVRIPGPSLVASRQRKRKAQRRDLHNNSKSEGSSPTADLTPGLTYSGASTPVSPTSPSSVSADFFVNGSSFPHVSLPRRPSTALGFSSGSTIMDNIGFQGLPQGFDTGTSGSSTNEAIESMLRFPIMMAPAPDPNTLISHESHGGSYSPFAQPLPIQPFTAPDSPIMFANPFLPFNNSVYPNQHPFAAPFQDWKIMENPSDDFNYAFHNAMEHPECLPK